MKKSLNEDKRKDEAPHLLEAQKVHSTSYNVFVIACGKNYGHTILPLASNLATTTRQ